MANLVLATCQFPIQKEIEKNLSYIIRQLKQSKEQGAHLVHFSEACLSGYLGSEVKSAKEINWEGSQVNDANRFNSHQTNKSIEIDGVERYIPKKPIFDEGDGVKLVNISRKTQAPSRIFQ